MNEAEFWVGVDTLEKNLPSLSARIKHICRVREWDIKRVGVWVKDKEVRLLYEFPDGYQTWSDDSGEVLIAHTMLVYLIENFDRIYFKEERDENE